MVGEADSVAEAVTLMRTSHPDVVLMDVDAANAETIDGMRRLRRELPDGALVVLTRHEDDEEVYRAVVGGADGHVSENAQPEELVETIKQAADGEEPIQRTLAERPAVGRRVLEAYAEMSSRAPALPEADVSAREIRILELAAEGKTNYQIGREIGLSEHTVKGAISALLATAAPPPPHRGRGSRPAPGLDLAAARRAGAYRATTPSIPRSRAGTRHEALNQETRQGHSLARFPLTR